MNFDNDKYLPMELPRCHIHNDVQMTYRKTEGESERWGGVWYDCPKCYCSVVFVGQDGDV